MSRIRYVETENDLRALFDRSYDTLGIDDEIIFKNDITLSNDLVIGKPIKHILLNGHAY